MPTSNWIVDVPHSSIEFSAKHMMFTTVRGTFHEFGATIQADPEDLTTAEIQFEIDVNSIDTRNADRDTHLKGNDFFDAENHAKINFRSSRIVKTGDGTYDVTGDLTIRGTTQDITFATEYGGRGKDPWGNEKVGFAATTKINRKDFGLVWNVALETGGVLVSDNISVQIAIQAQLAG